MPTNIIIYIHGITPNPASHKQDYNSFERNFQAALKALGKAHKYPTHRIDIEWGYDTTPTQPISTGDKLLADTERYLFNQADAVSDRAWDWTANPLRPVYQIIRKNFILGFADMFYYISEDGKAEVRQNVLSNILTKIQAINTDNPGHDNKYSFTIISHSAGTVVMHDLLFILFGGGSNPYITDQTHLQILKNLQQQAASGNINIHAFVTLGSPITPMIVRSQAMINIINARNKLSLSSIGLTNTDKAINFWLNFWEKDDVIAYPLEFLYDNPNNLLQDCYVDIGDFFPDVHNAYWLSEDIARIIAEHY